MKVKSIMEYKELESCWIMFYEIDDDILQHLKADIAERVTDDDSDCSIWNGELKKMDIPTYLFRGQEPSKRYDVKRLVFQINFPEQAVHHSRSVIITSTCGKNACVNPQHLLLQRLSELWEPLKFMQRLLL